MFIILNNNKNLSFQKSPRKNTLNHLISETGTFDFLPYLCVCEEPWVDGGRRPGGLQGLAHQEALLARQTRPPARDRWVYVDRRIDSY